MQVPEKIPGETGRDFALRTLRENIICLELAPGSLVSENELASAMQLSRTPVREAIMELARVGIVEVYPQRGSRISLIDLSLVEESSFMRLVLECAVAELDCKLATPEEIEVLRESVRLQRYYIDSFHPEKIMELDLEFHQQLFTIAGKTQIHSIMDNFLIHFDRVRRIGLTNQRAALVADDHEGIAEAIAARDPGLARTLMEKHLMRYRPDIKEMKKQYPNYFK